MYFNVAFLFFCVLNLIEECIFHIFFLFLQIGNKLS